MKNRYINQKIISTQDYGRLRRLIRIVPSQSYFLKRLNDLLNNAEVISSEFVPDSVVTMDSWVCLKDVRLEKSQIIRMTYPNDVGTGNRDFFENVSLLSPLGLSLLGQQVGDVLIGRIRIEQLVYQPETGNQCM